MKKVNKIMAALLAAAVSAGATGSIAYAKNSGKTQETLKKTAAPESGSEGSPRQDNGENAYKDETVYVLCNSDSSVKNVVVSDWLKNAPALGNISDISDLSDIVNVKGDQSFELNGENLSWDAEGSDIYYKGYSDKELPVDVTMEYFLDGNKVTPESIKGKSGHLVIRWTYKNNKKVTKNVNGKTALTYAMEHEASYEVIKLLIDHGADVNSKDVIYQKPGGFVGTNSKLFNSGSATKKEKELAKRVLKGEYFYPAKAGR